MRQEHAGFLWWSGTAVLLFRAELAMLLGILLLMELVSGRLPLLRWAPRRVFADQSSQSSLGLVAVVRS